MSLRNYQNDHQSLSINNKYGFSDELLFVLLFYRTFPESPRWLVAKGKTKKCLSVLKQIAKENGTLLPDNSLEILEKLERRREKVCGYASLFSSWRLLRNSVLITSCM
jgi:hypothetical protein